MEYTIFSTIFILNISRPLGQSDKLICYHAQKIFSYFFISCQTNSTLSYSINCILHFITLYGILYGNCFKVEMQQVTYITIPCLLTFKHSTFKAIKRCKQIAYFEDLEKPQTAFIKSG